MNNRSKFTQSILATFLLSCAGMVGCDNDDTDTSSSGVGGASTTQATGGSRAAGGSKSAGGSTAAVSTAAGGKSTTGGAGTVAAGTGGLSATAGASPLAGSPSVAGAGGIATAGNSSQAGAAGGGNAATRSIVEIAASNPDFSVLVAAATKAGLVDALGGGGLTVFAPTNAAFTKLLAAIGKTSLDDLSAAQLRPILLYHVVGAKVDAAAATSVAAGAGKVETLGGTAKIAKTGNDLVLDGKAKVTTSDIMASNGIIHVIDQVILPSITDLVVSTSSFSSLKTALLVADSDTSNPNLIGAFDDDTASLTLVAPNDEAFSGALVANNLADLPALVTALGGKSGLVNVLKYHAASAKLYAADVVAASGKTVPTLLSGASFTVAVAGGSVVLNQSVKSAFLGLNDAKVVTTDLYTSNGVVHVIDKIVAPAAPLKSIIELGMADPNFSVLVAAVNKAGLASALSGENLTLFAPTNAAFTALLTAIGKTSLNDLTAEQLSPILRYHVVGAKVPAAAALAVATGDGKVQTLGGTARIAKVGSDLVLDGRAKVTSADLMASNGVVHVIDQVILPSITDLVISSPNLVSLKTALTVADSDASSPNLIGTFDNDAASLTLLAPNDAAFSGALSANGLADLPALVTALGGTPGLINVLKYHAASGKLYASDVVAANGKTVPTLLSGATFTVTVSGSSVVLNQGVNSGFLGLNDSKVVTTDIYTSNGVVHLIDKVIAPKK